MHSVETVRAALKKAFEVIEWMAFAKEML